MDTNNNWTKKNVETIRSWKNSIYKTSFIYETILEKYKKRLDYMLIATIILGTIATVITAIISSLLTNNTNPTIIWIAFAGNIILFFINGLTTVINGTIKILKLDQQVTNLNSFIEKIENLYTIMANELILPDKLRKDAIEFIKNSNTSFLETMKQCPNVYQSDLVRGYYLYDQFVNVTNKNKPNFRLAQFQNDDIIEIV